jgi:hypothetical protein
MYDPELRSFLTRQLRLAENPRELLHLSRGIRVRFTSLIAELEARPVPDPQAADLLSRLRLLTLWQENWSALELQLRLVRTLHEALQRPVGR